MFKKKSLLVNSFLTCISLALLFATTAIAQSNLIVNPGAESGLSPWTGSGETTTAKENSGSYAFLTKNPAPYLEQTITGLTPGARYRLSGYVYQSGNTGASTLALGAKDFGGSIEESSDQGQSWHQLSMEFDVSTSTATIYLEHKRDGWSWCYFDDLVLEFVTGGEPTPTINLSQTTMTITEEDVDPLDGDPMKGLFYINLTLDQSSSQDISVTINATDGSASAGSDYSGFPVTLTIPANVTSMSQEAKIEEDMYIEGDETFSITLSNPVNAQLGDSTTATITIRDNDYASDLGEIFFTGVNNYERTEANQTVVLPFGFSGKSYGPVSFTCTIEGGSNSDYAPATGTVAFDYWDRYGYNREFVLNLLDDSEYEGTEVYTVRFGNVTGGVTFMEPSSTTITVIDNDPEPTTPVINTFESDISVITQPDQCATISWDISNATFIRLSTSCPPQWEEVVPIGSRSFCPSCVNEDQYTIDLEASDDFGNVVHSTIAISIDTATESSVPNNEKIAISGELYDASGNPVGYPDPALVDITIRLYNAATAGTIMYEETFFASDSQAVLVSDALFTAYLGNGTTSEYLPAVIAGNNNLFAEITINSGTENVLMPRTPLTASPYAIAPRVVNGEGDPNVNSVSGAIGTYYVNNTDSTTWLKLFSIWKLLD